MTFFMGCNQTSVTEIPKESSLELNLRESKFKTGDIIHLEYTASNASKKVATVEITVPTRIQLENNTTIAVPAQSTRKFVVSAKLNRAGYYNITSSLLISGIQEPINTMTGVNVSSTNLQPLAVAVAANKSIGIESLEEHIKKLPVVTNYVLANEQAKAERENRDNVRNDYVMNGVKALRNGQEIELPTMAISYMEGTGSGEMTPEELSGIRPNTAPNLRLQAACTTNPATAELKMRSPIFPNTIYPLTGFVVKVFDHNGIWPHALIAERVLDSTGKISYPQPTCDADAAYLNTGPDIYFTIEARIPNSGNASLAGQSIHDGIRIVTGFAAQHGLATADAGNYLIGTTSGTINNTLALNHSMTINPIGNWGAQALWVGVLTKFAQDFLHKSMSKRIGMAVFYPGVFSNSSIYSAFAPGSRIILGENAWKRTFPLIHEFGHNVRYQISHPTWYSGCLGVTLPCDPWFAPCPATCYDHFHDTTTTKEIALNEGFAQTFYEFAREDENSSEYWDALPEYYRNCRTTNSICNSLPTGQTNESRIGTFLWQYAKQIIARNDFSTTAKRRVAFNTLAYSWRDTGGFAQGIYTLWDPYMKRSFPTGAANLPNPCGSTAALQASDTVTNVFQCIALQTTLTDGVMTP